MFQNHDMVRKPILILIIATAASILVMSLYEINPANMCKMRELDIQSKIVQYEKTKDPQFCDSLNSQITQFDEQCKSDIEIQDCG